MRWLATLALAACVHAPPEAAPVTTPDHILTILAVSDLETAAVFYQQAFGWPLGVDVPVYKQLDLPGGRSLGLYVREGFAHNVGGLVPEVVAPGAITGTELYFRVADLDAAVARLEAAGARVLSPRAPRDWGDEAAYFADPDGNALVVAVPLAPVAGARRR
ncbi:MAG: VOC family protein [Pseudomonadota bacterium]